MYFTYLNVYQFCLFVTLSLCFSCKNSTQDNSPISSSENSQQINPEGYIRPVGSAKQLLKIEQQIAQIMQIPNIDLQKDLVVQTIKDVKLFVAQHPRVAEAPKVLAQTAEFARGIGNTGEALNMYDRLATKFPNHKLSAAALFFQGFIMENEVGNLEVAKNKYTELIARFPDHEMAIDAKKALLNIGKSPAQLIKEFKANQEN